MKIGFIGFGKVASNLTQIIASPNITFYTSGENRSNETLKTIKNSDVEVLTDFKEVCRYCDIVISTTFPANALDVAKKYGKYCSGIYLDLNNISPENTFKINQYVSNFVDGAIIGKIDSNNPLIYLSGKKADDLLFLDEFIKTKKISDEIGSASKLKLLRSTYTKSLSALLIETYELANSLDLSDEFFDVLSETEGDDFRDKSLSRIKNTQKSSKRKIEELEEILDYFGDLKMVEAALEILKQY